MLMQDCVMTLAGSTYECSFITEWLKTHNTDPLTGMELPSKQLIPNQALKGAIAEWKEKHPHYREKNRAAGSRSAVTTTTKKIKRVISCLSHFCTVQSKKSIFYIIYQIPTKT